MYCNVLVTQPFDNTFTYKVPSNQIVKPGNIVKVPFGKKKDQIGVVYELCDNNEIRNKSFTIKEILHVYNNIISMLRDNELTKLLKAYKLFVNYEDDEQMLNNIKINTLVTTGQHDVGSTTEMAKKLSEKIKNAKYVEIKNGKHLCNIECAKEFNKTIELFVDQNYDEN